MSFFKKFTKEFEGLKTTFLKDDDKKTEKKEEKPGEQGHEGQRSDPSAGGSSYAGFGHPESQQPYGQQSQYGQPSQYGQQPQYGQQSQYGGPPPQHGGPPPSDNSLPPGWNKQWDANSQRWYYVEQATGRTQWDPPSFSAPPPAGGPANYPPQGGYGGFVLPGQTQHDEHAREYYGDIAKKEQEGGTVKKDKGRGGMLAGAAGGLAVGAVGGALIGHAMGDDSSDDEHHLAAPMAAAPLGASSYQNPPTQYQNPSPFENVPPAPAPLPDETASGSSVSSSDREDVEEAREDYQEALRDGDREEIAEAREDYQEEYEETYDD